MSAPATRTSRRRVLTSQQDLRSAIVEVTGTATRRLSIFTQDLEPAIYDHDAFLEAVKRFVLSRSFARVRVLINTPGRTIRNGHRFVTMGRRLNSYIEFRNVREEFGPHPEAYLIADDTGLVYRADASRWDGMSETFQPAIARMYLEEFDTVWEGCETHQELRALHV